MIALAGQFKPRKTRPEPGSFDSTGAWHEAATNAAQSNMADFIRAVRAKSRFLRLDGGSRWNDLRWRITSNRGFDRTMTCSFTTVARSSDPLPEPFAEQSRAVVAAILLRRPGVHPAQIIRALRLIYHAMVQTDGKPDLTFLDQHRIDGLNASIISGMNRGSRHFLGTFLEDIVNRVLSAGNLTIQPVCYHSPFSAADANRLDNHIIWSQKDETERENSKAAKLPDLEAVFSLADLFHQPGWEHRDVNLVAGSLAALLLFAPSRISEILTLPANCTTVADRGERRRFGLMWRPAKGGMPMTKFVAAPEWEEVLKEAIDRLTVLGASARSAAEWYEENPGMLYLPPGTGHLRGRPLTAVDVAKIIGLEPAGKPEFRTARSMLDFLTTADDHGTRAVPPFPWERVREFVRQHLKNCPGPLPSHLENAAEWLEQPNNGSISKALEIVPGQPMTLARSLAILNLSERDLDLPEAIRRITAQLRQVKVAGCDRPAGQPSGCPLYSFQSLESWVLKRLQSKMPFVHRRVGLKYSQALFCLPRGIICPSHPTLWNVPFWLSAKRVNSILNGNSNKISIFALNRITDPKTGRPRELRSHQFRHLINTMAQFKFLSGQLIAFWSGRRDAGQNQTYNHVGQEYVIEAWQMLNRQSGDRARRLNVLHDLAVKRSQLESISYREALSLTLGAIHVTRFGLCRHDFAFSPCPHERDCANCNESLFIAHDGKTLEEVEFQVNMHRNAVNSCDLAIQDGEPDAERWRRVHERNLEAWTRIRELVTDGSTPPGTIVRLPPNGTAQSAAEFTMNSHDNTNQSGTRQAGKTGMNSGQHQSGQNRRSQDGKSSQRQRHRNRRQTA